MTTAPDPTKDVAITNSAGIPLALIIPTISTQTTDGNGTMVYGQSLELLTAIDGGTDIPDGATKTFVLDQTYLDPKTGKNEYSTIYNLLPATASWFSPVANLSVMQTFDNPPSYPPQTVAKTDVQAFKDTALFVQTISAYPTSALATNYQQALTQAQTNASVAADGSPDSGANTAQAISDTVNKFFQGTKTFKDVTLEAVVAMQSYYGSFPFVWAEFATSAVTYYLYSSNGTATSFVGTISLTPPARVDVGLANGGYTCTFSPARNGSDTTSVDVDPSQSKSLTYSGGLFVDDVNSDIPQVAVKGTFQIKSTFTAKPADTQIITVLTGTITGSTCIGFDQPQKSNDPSSEFWDTLFHPKNSAQIFQSVMTIGGALMLLVFVGQGLYAVGKWAKEMWYGKEPTTKELLEAQSAKFEASQKELVDTLVKQLSGGKQTAPDSPADAADVVQAQTSMVADNQAAARLENGLAKQGENLEEIAKFESDMNDGQITQLESLGTDFRASNAALTNADTTDLGGVVSTQTTSLRAQNTGFDGLKTDLGTKIGEQQRTSMEQNAEAVTRAAEESENVTNSDENLPKDDNPPAEEPIEG
jgi:hypothetical protein